MIKKILALFVLCFFLPFNSVFSDNKILSNGGRVLNFVSLSENFSETKKNVYNNLKILDWSEGYYRRDIGFKVTD